MANLVLIIHPIANNENLLEEDVQGKSTFVIIIFCIKEQNSNITLQTSILKIGFYVRKEAY